MIIIVLHTSWRWPSVDVEWSKFHMCIERKKHSPMKRPHFSRQMIYTFHKVRKRSNLAFLGATWTVVYLSTLQNNPYSIINVLFWIRQLLFNLPKHFQRISIRSRCFYALLPLPSSSPLITSVVISFRCTAVSPR